MKIAGIDLSWWWWALITWGACLLITIVVAIVAPDDLWTVPTLNEAKLSELTNENFCDNCSLYKDQLYLTVLRKDQCEFPHFTNIVSCDVSAETGVNPAQCKPQLSAPIGGKLCGTATIVEPQNTWSNFAYLLAGILILFRGPKLLGIAVGVNFCLMFLFSGLYHASLQNVWQALDVAWIYVLLLSLIAYASESLKRRYVKERFSCIVTIMSVAIPAAIGILVAALKASGNLPKSDLTDSTYLTLALVGILGIPVLILMLDFWWLDLNIDGFKTWSGNLFAREYIWGQQWKFQLWMFIPALVGGMLRTALVGLPGDGCGHSLCRPHSFFQAHAAWHVLGAMALWWTYNFLAQASASTETMVPLGNFEQ